MRSEAAEATRRRLEAAAAAKEAEERKAAAQRASRRAPHKVGGLSAEEKAARLAEMQQNAEAHDRDRGERLQRAEDRDAAEDGALAQSKLFSQLHCPHVPFCPAEPYCCEHDCLKALALGCAAMQRRRPCQVCASGS